MSLKFVGQTFPPNSPWYTNEIAIIHSVQTQIQQAFGSANNLLINTTWFGPQFAQPGYENFLDLIAEQKFDNLFLLATVDPCYLNSQQIQTVIDLSGASQTFRLGNFAGSYQFDFFAQAVQRSFQHWTDKDLQMQTADYVYINYNRKPRPHRIALVQKLIAADLLNCGKVTLGENSEIGAIIDSHCDPVRPTDSLAYGIPNDTHSFGNIDLWRRHFLNVVSETEFFPWDELFVSEKTWKPIVGMRPFVINGQTTVYQWLRNQGFRTFERYWPHIETEHIAEHEVHDAIVAVLNYLRCKSTAEINAMYADMLPDLHHNRQRYAEFCSEQKIKINNLFHAG